MAITTPDFKHQRHRSLICTPGIDWRIVNDKLWHWKRLLEDEDSTPTWGYQKEWRVRPTPSPDPNQTPPLFDAMNPLEYWKGLTEWKNREIAYLDQGHPKNPRYWEAKYRLVSDALDTLKTFKQDWMGPVRNLCSPTEKSDTDISPSSAPHAPSSPTSPPTSVEPDLASLPPKSILWRQRSLQATEQSQSQTVFKKEAKFHEKWMGRRSARLASKHTLARVFPPDPEPTTTSELKTHSTGASRGLKRKRDTFDSGLNARVSRRRGGNILSSPSRQLLS